MINCPCQIFYLRVEKVIWAFMRYYVVTEVAFLFASSTTFGHNIISMSKHLFHPR